MRPRVPKLKPLIKNGKGLKESFLMGHDLYMSTTAGIGVRGRDVSGAIQANPHTSSGAALWFVQHGTMMIEQWSIVIRIWKSLIFQDQHDGGNPRVQIMENEGVYKGEIVARDPWAEDRTEER
jgi:hypothetical protein